MKRILTACSFAAAFLFFLLVMDYPFLARLWNEAHQAEVIEQHDDSLYETEDREKSEELLKAQAYNASLASGLLGGIEDISPNQMSETSYQTLLNSGEDGIMGTLEIPNISGSLSWNRGGDSSEGRRPSGRLLPSCRRRKHPCPDLRPQGACAEKDVYQFGPDGKRRPFSSSYSGRHALLSGTGHTCGKTRRSGKPEDKKRRRPGNADHMYPLRAKYAPASGRGREMFLYFGGTGRD